MSTPTFDPALRSYYKEESDRIRRDFEGDGSGRECTQSRTQLVDKLLLQLWVQQPAVVIHRGIRHGCAGRLWAQGAVSALRH